jgi:hypothetical protein
MKDASARLRTATRRAKSDVANKLVSMFLHEFSRRISQDWPLKVGSEEYGTAVREAFLNRCPYCLRNLSDADWVVEHLDGMNKSRAGLHVPGNVVVACRKCNNEKRRDDSQQTLALAATGWESFLSHDGTRCTPPCQTCLYWQGIWPDKDERQRIMAENLRQIRLFRAQFTEFQAIIPSLVATMPHALAKLYSDCQQFAEDEIKALLQKLDGSRRTQTDHCRE